MCLNDFGRIAHETWEETPSIRPNISLGAFTVMPNHFHGIIEIHSQSELLKRKQAESDMVNRGFRSPSHNLGALIRGYKGSATKKVREYIRDSEGELEFFPITKSKNNASVPIHRSDLINTSESIWQRNYFDQIIRDQESYDQISKYIIDNPVNRETDKFR